MTGPEQYRTHCESQTGRRHVWVSTSGCYLSPGLLNAWRRRDESTGWEAYLAIARDGFAPCCVGASINRSSRGMTADIRRSDRYRPPQPGASCGRPYSAWVLEFVELSEIRISPTVRAKIQGKHGLDDDDVLDACEDVIDLGWVYDEERGWRLFVEGWARTQMRICVILYPTADPAAWRLGTAFRG